jgi:hypothetical protein
MKIKKTGLLALVCFLTLTLVAAEASKPVAFEVRLVLDNPASDSEQMTTSPTGKEGQTELLHVQKRPLIDQNAVKSASVQKNPQTGASEIEVVFTEEGAQRFAEVTRQNIDKRLAIVVAGRVLSAPVVRAEISGGRAVISGNFSEQEATQLAEKISVDAAAQSKPKRIAGTFVCEAVPSNSLVLNLDGSFTVRESSHTLSGTYTINGTSITLKPAGSEPIQMGQLEGDRFIDPHGSPWSRKKS